MDKELINSYQKSYLNFDNKSLFFVKKIKVKNDSFSVYGNTIMNNGAFKEGDITFLFEKDGSLMKGCEVVSQKEAESLYDELVKKQKRRFGFKGEQL